MENVELTIHPDALNSIAKKAIERKTGARGLRSIMEAILLDTMFDLPGLDGVQEVVISPEVVEGQGAAALHLFRPPRGRRFNRFVSGAAVVAALEFALRTFVGRRRVLNTPAAQRHLM